VSLYAGKDTGDFSVTLIRKEGRKHLPRFRNENRYLAKRCQTPKDMCTVAGSTRN